MKTAKQRNVPHASFPLRISVWTDDMKWVLRGSTVSTLLVDNCSQNLSLRRLRTEYGGKRMSSVPVETPTPMRECITVITETSSIEQKKSLERYDLAFRVLIRVINDRINHIWNSRETNLLPTGASARIVEASQLYYDIQYTSTAFEQIVRSYTGTCFHSIRLLRHAVAVVLPSFLRRLHTFLQSSTKDALQEPLKQYITKHPQVFLVQWRRHIGGVSTFMRLLSTCTAGNDANQTSASSQQARSEQELFEIIRCFAVDPVWKSFALVRPDEKPIHFAALAMNSAMTGFLTYIITAGCQFDELGVYKLYRVLLKLTEYVGVLRKELGLQPSERLIGDITQWRRAEAVLQVLNSAVFHKSARSSGSKHSITASAGNTVASRGNAGYGSIQEAEAGASAGAGSVSGPSQSALLTAEEAAQWQALATSPQRGITLFRNSRRHKGTVFVTLELSVDNL